MTNKLKQHLYSLADWTFDRIVDVVYHILRLQWLLAKLLSRLTWQSVKFTAWSVTKKDFWKGLLVSLPATAFCVLLALTLSYFKPYTGTYFGYENKILSDKEMRLINEVREYREKKDQLQMLEDLSHGKVEAIKWYAQVKFGESWKLAVATFKAESGLRCGIVQDWMNYDKSADYGIAQINSTHLWMVDNEPKRLLDCKTNIDVAYRVWDRADGKEGNKQGSFTPWVAYNDGRADQFLSSL